MSAVATIAVRVRAARGSSNVTISTSGRYVGLTTNAINLTVNRQPVQPTASAKAFWTSVLAIVQAQITALP
jgi:hypothetical protein